MANLVFKNENKNDQSRKIIWFNSVLKESYKNNVFSFFFLKDR